jgi:TRAP-type C4-dicarboxylate transport system substrate-binding protein
MKMGKRMILTGFIGLAFALTMMTIQGTGAQAAQKVIKIPCTMHFPPPPPPPAKPAADIRSFVNFANRVKEATDGRVLIEFFWGSSLGKVGDFIRMVGNPGIADAGVIVTVYHKWEIPLTAGVTLPFLSSNLQVQAQGLMELYETWKPLRDEWDKANCEVLGLTTIPHAAVGTKTKQIQTLDDFKGMKIWGVGYYADAMNAVGTKVVSFPGGDIYEGLSKGVIDGAWFPYTGHHMFGFYELLKYETNTDFVGAHGNLLWVINKDVWNQISKDDQKIMRKFAGEILDDFLAGFKEENIRVNEALLKKGLKFNTLSAADQAKWRELAGVPIEKSWLAEMDKRGQGENARELLKRYRALINKYEPRAKYEFIWPK